jgi:hypothetical protein
MMWEAEQQDQELLEHYRRLIALRKRHTALRANGVCTCLAQNEGNVYAFLRGELGMNGDPPGNDAVLVVLNNSPETQLIEVPLQVRGRGVQPCWAVGMIVKDILGEHIYTVEQDRVILQLGAYQGARIANHHETFWVCHIWYTHTITTIYTNQLPVLRKIEKSRCHDRCPH